MKVSDLKVGDLIRWVDYAHKNGFVVNAGLFLRPIVSPTDFRDIVVLHNGKETLWCAFQCEVFNENR